MIANYIMNQVTAIKLGIIKQISLNVPLVFL